MTTDREPNYKDSQLTLWGEAGFLMPVHSVAAEAPFSLAGRGRAFSYTEGI